MNLVKLKEIRNKNNITMEEMGQKLGISKVSYWKIEHGKTQLSYINAQKIAGIFFLKPEDIFLPNELTKEEQNV